MKKNVRQLSLQDELYKVIEDMAVMEDRSTSNMVHVLLKEALQGRKVSTADITIMPSRRVNRSTTG